MNTQTAEELLGKVKKDYSRIAKPFDATRQSPWKEFDRFGSYLEANQRLLDIGCGNGRLFSFLKDKHVSYLGVDNNGVFLELAKKNFPDAEFRNADVLSLPFASASFDHVWNIAALHHIPSKALRMKALREMKRVLKKDGYLMTTVWNLWQKKYRARTFASVLRNFFMRKYDWNDTFIPFQEVERYYHAFTLSELRNLFEEAGLQIQDIWSTDRNICLIAKKHH